MTSIRLKYVHCFADRFGHVRFISVIAAIGGRCRDRTKRDLRPLTMRC
jgi:hypothetical protein